MDLPSVAFALFFLIFDIQVLIDHQPTRLGGYMEHASNKLELKPSTDYMELKYCNIVII